MKSFIGVLIACLSLFSGGVSAQSEDSRIQPDNLFPQVKFVTNKGEMLVELDRMRAPRTVDNFLVYVVEGAYNNTIFHRVIEDFVVQGGGFHPDWEQVESRDPVINESGNGLRNDFGTIAMARQSQPHSALNQFYFNVNDNENLNPSTRRWGYAVFGRVIENDELLRELAAVETGTDEEMGYPDVPVEPLILERVELLPRDR